MHLANAIGFSKSKAHFTLLLLLTGLMFGCATKPEHVRTSQETIAIQKPKMVDGVSLFLLIDESGSMYGANGTDPNGLRYEASKYLIQNLLVKKSDPQYPNRLAIIHFGDHAFSEGLSDLTIGGAKKLSEKVRSPFTTHLGNTSFIEALKKAVEIDEQTVAYKNLRNKIIVIFTDGEPDDVRRLRIPQYFDEIQSFVRNNTKGFTLFVIGIDNNASKVKFTETIPYWKKIAGEKNVFALREVKDLYTKFNEAVRRIFELPEVEQVNVTKPQDFEVQPYLDKLEFHIFTESNIKVGIRRPNGTLLNPNDVGVSVNKGDNYDILTVDEPTPGVWRYEILEGSGSVNILRNPIPFRLRLIYPEEVYPVGKPLLMRAAFTKENGEEIKELPDYPLSFTAKIASPDYTDVDKDVQFLPKNKVGKIYYADVSVKLERPGQYHTKLRVKGGTRFETSSTQKIFVQSFPYLELQQPKPLETRPLDASFDVEATLKRENQISDPQKEFQDNPNDLVLAQIISSPDGAKSPAIWLSYAGDGKFRGAIPFALKREGGYAVAIQIKGEPRLSNEVIPTKAIEVVDFYVAPTVWQSLRSVLTTVLVIGLAFFVIWTLWIIIWLSVLTKKFSGNLTVLVNNEALVRGYQDGLRWLKPRKVKLEVLDEGHDDEDGKPVKKVVKVTFWLRAKNEDAVVVYSGGWLSVYTMGLFSNKVLVSKDDVSSELGEHIKIQVGR